MKLFFTRHGESVANLLHEFSNSGIKHPLTDQGLSQAHVLAESLVGLQFSELYSSPVLRAVQTAKIVSERLGIPMQITEALREWSVGIYEGTTGPEGWELHRSVQEDWFYHQKLESKMPGGESFLEIQQRFFPFINSLVQNRTDPDHSILLVAHGGLYLAMLPALLKNVEQTFAIEHNVGYTGVVVAETRPGGLVCTSWCGIPFENR